MSWQHPTGKAPKSVCLVCLGPSKHSLLELTTGHQPDKLLMAVDEVWGINGGVNHFVGRVCWDILWTLDFLQGEEAKEPYYGQLIRQWLARFPASHLITTEADNTWPANVHEYPFAQIAAAITALGGHEAVWMRNSVPLIAAYAWYIGVERFYIFGADYHHEALKLREDDKGNAEAWLHWLRMNGCQVITSTDSTILDSNKPKWIYGYQRQPTWDEKSGVWLTAPSQRAPSGVSAPNQGGLPPNPHIPEKGRCLVDTLDHQDEERLVELTAKVERGKALRW